MSTSPDDRSRSDSADVVVNIDLYISHFINSVQHSAHPLSRGSGVGSASEKRQWGPGPLPDAARDILARAMLGRGVAAGLIGAIFDLDAVGVADLAVDLDQPRPPDRVIRIADDRCLTPGSLAPPEHAPLRFYTPRQLKFLVGSWLGSAPIESMATTLGRSPEAIKRKARTLGLMMRQRQALREQLARYGEVGVPSRGRAETPWDWRSPGVEPVVPEPTSGPRCPSQSEPVEDRGRRKRRIIAWEATRTKKLCDLWQAGVRPGEIADRLGCSALSISTKAVRLSLPARGRDDNGNLESPQGYICYDGKHDEYFWSRRRGALQSSWRISQAARANVA